MVAAALGSHAHSERQTAMHSNIHQRKHSGEENGIICGKVEDLDI